MTDPVPGLDFEKPILDLEQRLAELQAVSETEKMNLSSEIKEMEEQLEQTKREIYGGLTSWQRVLVARHPRRPYTLDYVGFLCEEFVELHGDRGFADDEALVGGTAVFEKQPVVILGHQKGRSLQESMRRNFGMPHPEGYRKALRLMRLAEKFSRPVFCFIDTPGAYPGIGAEERGQAQAIAENLRVMAGLKTPILSIVIGEGGSGGALAIGVADRILMSEHAWYSVISPEGCAAILFRDAARAPEAAEALKLTAGYLQSLGIVDEVIAEPLGGAHRDPTGAAEAMREVLKRHMTELMAKPIPDLVKERYQKYRRMGAWQEEASHKTAPKRTPARAKASNKLKERQDIRWPHRRQSRRATPGSNL